MLTSRDGVTWTPSETGLAFGLRDVAYGEGQFVATGSRGTIVTASTRGTGLSDLGDSHPESDAVDALVRLGVAYGFPDGTFRPDQPIARAQLVKMTAAAAGLKPEDVLATAAYPDVKPADWFAGWASAAVNAGLIGPGWPFEVFVDRRFEGNRRPSAATSLFDTER